MIFRDVLLPCYTYMGMVLSGFTAPSVLGCKGSCLWHQAVRFILPLENMKNSLLHALKDSYNSIAITILDTHFLP